MCGQGSEDRVPKRRTPYISRMGEDIPRMGEDISRMGEDISRIGEGASLNWMEGEGEEQDKKEMSASW